MGFLDSLCSLFFSFLSTVGFLFNILGFLFRLSCHYTKAIRHSLSSRTTSRQIVSCDAFGTSFGFTSKTSFLFLRLPRELRDTIYRMLLTTTYNCTEDIFYAEREDAYHNLLQPNICFKLHPAILQANKQIAHEGRRALYDENLFVVFSYLLLCQGQTFDATLVPNFRKLREEKVVAPALRLSMRSLEDAHLGSDNWQTMVTVVDSIPALIRSMWRFFEERNPSEWRLEATVQSKTRSRIDFLREDLMAPLKLLYGFGEVWVGGNMANSDLEALRHCMTTKPRPKEMMHNLKVYQKRAEACFDQMNYSVAWSSWERMRGYWRFCFDKDERRSMFAGFLEGDLKGVWPMMLEANLGQVKILIHLRQYEAAKEFVMRPLVLWVAPDFLWEYPSMTRGHLHSLLRAKYFLCYALAITALGHSDLGTRQVEGAVDLLLKSKLCSSCDPIDLYKELCWGILDHLGWVGTPLEPACPSMVCPHELDKSSGNGQLDLCHSGNG